ncbi:MAG: thioredoxin domain-containing protein [Gammaproteobacteria bacterium]|nr:thioredoxin domain-containing protein [Gammaproteobacteria bacterium]
MKLPNDKTSSEFIFNIDEDQFQKRVIEASHNRPVLVDFWADWCSPCLMIAPVLKKVIPEYEGKLLLAKIDADENMKLCGHYRLRGFPTLLLFVDGEEVARIGGAQSAQALRSFIDPHMPVE